MFTTIKIPSEFNLFNLPLPSLIHYPYPCHHWPLCDLYSCVFSECYNWNHTTCRLFHARLFPVSNMHEATYTISLSGSRTWPSKIFTCWGVEEALGIFCDCSVFPLPEPRGFFSDLCLENQVRFPLWKDGDLPKTSLSSSTLSKLPFKCFYPFWVQHFKIQSSGSWIDCFSRFSLSLHTLESVVCLKFFFITNGLNLGQYFHFV